MNTINATRTSASKFNTKYMVELALMVAVILVMSLTPLGYIRTPGLSITLLTVPVAGGAIILGPVGGLICGLAFGLTSFYQCFVGGAMGTVLLGINPFGTFVTQTTCPHCNGTGKEIKVKCPDCHGKGYINKTVTVQLDIPAGINDGQQLRVAGKGGRGANGGPNGDLFVEIRVRNNTHFVREGRNIHMTIPISSIDATLGCEIDVPTVQGDVKVKIPAGTQSGTTLRLKGKGVKDLRGSSYGDQMVKVDVKIPTKLSSKEKSLYEQLQKLNKKESIFDSFKKQFKK